MDEQDDKVEPKSVEAVFTSVGCETVIVYHYSRKHE